MTRQIKVIAQCCAFLVSCFCGGEAVANINDYTTEVTLDLIERSVTDKSNKVSSVNIDSDNLVIPLPEVKIANRTSAKYKLKNNLNHTISLTLDCENNKQVAANLNFNTATVKAKGNSGNYSLRASPTLKLDHSLINKTGIKKCTLTNKPLALNKLISYGGNDTFNIGVTLNIAPYIHINNKTIDAKLSKQQSGDYTKQVEIPVETNANNIKLTLSSCTYSDGNTCQLKHEDINHKVPIYINDGNSEIKINEHISKSGFTNINNTFFLDLKTNKDDINDAKAGKYAGKINLKLEASF